jgi:hypothetical protein
VCVSVIRLLENAYFHDPSTETAIRYILQDTINEIVGATKDGGASISGNQLFNFASTITDPKDLALENASTVQYVIGMLEVAKGENKRALQKTVRDNFEYVQSHVPNDTITMDYGTTTDKRGKQYRATPLSRALELIQGSEKKRLPVEELCQVLIDQTSFQKGFKFFKWVVDNNLPVCFGILSFRPNQIWSMGSLCLTFGGGEVGNMLYMLPDFQVENDSVRKVMFAAFTVYAGCLITDPRKIVIIPDVFCNGYTSGWATSPWDASNPRHRQEQARDPTKRDYYHCLVEAIFKAEDKWIFLNGKGPEQVNGASKSTKLSYSTAEYYSTEIWSNWESGESNLVSQINSTQNNTMCFQDYQASYNLLNPGRALVTHNTGPWQERLYEGSAHARASGKVFLEPVNTQRISLMSIGA